MATTAYTTSNALTQKLWAKKLFVDALKECYVGKFIGTSSNSLIHMKTETSKSRGDQVTVGLRMQLSGNGVSGDSTLEGSEEALTTYSDAVVINQLRHAVRSDGRMSQQRVNFDIREEAYQGLKDWMADRIDTWFFNQVCGNTAQTDTRFTGMQSVTAPAATRQLWTEAGTTDDTNLDSSGDDFSITQIDKAVATAKTASPTIRPVRVDGKDMYVMFLHPYQVYQMRTNTNTAQWADIQKAAMMGGKVESNPIFTGALGVYNNVILHESTRVTTGVTSTTTVVSNVRRAVFCGAQAALLAFGQDNTDQKLTWEEELFDYGNQLGVAVGLIGGLKKTIFNSVDFGAIVVSSYSPAPT